MKMAKPISIVLPRDLAAKARKAAAREHRTVNELALEALRNYLSSDVAWRRLLERTRATGARLRVKNERDVERLSDEYRASKRV